MENQRITPTKENPSFLATCSAFGNLENGLYKMSTVNNCSFDTFGISFAESVNDLHKWIQKNKGILKEYPKCKFELYAVDGSIDNHGDFIARKVYTITASKAKKYLLNS